MDKLLYLLPILACPIMMIAMMWMMRGNHNTAQSSDASAAQHSPDANADEIAQLRAEIASLREQQSSSAGETTRHVS